MNREIQDILDTHEDLAFQEIIDEQEGKLGLDEHATFSTAPPDAVLKNWTRELNKLSRHQHSNVRPPKWGRRVLAGAAALVVVLCVSVEAFRVELYNLYASVMSKCTQIQLNEPLEVIVGRWNDVLIPTVIPQGFVLSDADHSSDMVFLEYLNSSTGERIRYYQYAADNHLRLDTELAGEKRACIIGAQTGYIFEKNGQSTLYWSIDNSAFSIEFTTSAVAEAEIVKMAESIAQ